MARRKFSSEKLYKLSKQVVIIITALAVISAILMFRQHNDFNNEFVKDYDNCKQKYPNNLQMEVSCGHGLPDTDLEIAYQANETFNKSVSIALFLPLIFFGGGAIIRYIFPEGK